ncbi:phosphate ABC transporter substrate-binding protein PstS [Rugosimonospora africana]|uniref:Phosphate ABC transporter substrate-binding protein PstS n=1 Tax=Rugosimonospora africana TaxID=556532 RepID=A0A8J3R252_9ACTN|nr:phosphate ABC transporter substrate-binding protein PstS [Rugosimonospora africana]
MALAVLTAPVPAFADTYVPIDGAGSSWAANAVNQWTTDVKQYGMRVTYAGNGSSDGRQRFLAQTVHFAASDIPFQQHPTDGSSPENPTPNTYAYMPIVAGGTAFMYNLKIGGRRVTNLRLSGPVIAKIFTGGITRWNDPAIVADNPGLNMPAEKIVPVIRSDGSGSSAQFSLWMQNQQLSIWNAFCAKHSCGLGATSYWPTFAGAIAQSGDLGVSGYVAQSYAEGAIGYVEYSYAINRGFPVAKMLNAAGYYTEPTPYNVAVALLKAKINTDASNPAVYLTQDLTDVYAYTDPRVYPMSSYSYFILPTVTSKKVSTDAGRTLAAFSYFFECQGQQQAPDLGYSPLPINLVQASFDQIKKIPGAVTQNINIQGCNNPTFSRDGHNKLVDVAPQPQACDKRGPTQCVNGTGGAKSQTTPSKGGTRTSGGGGSTTGVTASGSPTPGASLRYDPATDQYVGAGGDGGTDQAVAGVPVALAARRGWSGEQTLMLLAAAVVLGLVLAPGAVSLLLGGRRSR